MPITYRQLGEEIARMNAEQLESNVTIHLQSIDEFIPVDHLELNDAEQEDDRLDDGHPVLIVFDAKIKDSYENGECPDCGEEIPDDMVFGGECKNCGHVFWRNTEE